MSHCCSMRVTNSSADVTTTFGSAASALTPCNARLDNEGRNDAARTRWHDPVHTSGMSRSVSLALPINGQPTRAMAARMVPTVSGTGRNVVLSWRLEAGCCRPALSRKTCGEELHQLVGSSTIMQTTTCRPRRLAFEPSAHEFSDGSSHRAPGNVIYCSTHSKLRRSCRRSAPRCSNTGRTARALWKAPCAHPANDRIAR